MRHHKVSSVTKGLPGDSSSNGELHHQRGRISKLIRYVGGKLKTSFAVVGVATAAALYYEYKTLFPTKSAEDEKKKVLVIPFHRIQLKDKYERQFSSLSQWGPDASDRPLQLDVRQLVDLIHEAAADPNIVALYGIFGHGSLLSSAGWADLEEIRFALKVFREAHRVHGQPNLSHELHKVIKRDERKPMYAYADTFSSHMDPGNKDYYLASKFTHLHLQERGELNLFGLLSQQIFLRNTLEKYGIVLHVFKHGQYKNAPNMFTESGFTRAHRENVTNILEGIDSDVCVDITRSRSKSLLASWLKKSNSELWKRIHQSGTFPAVTAWKAGLIDYLPRRDPLPDLVASNESDEKKAKMKETWKIQETDFNTFKADKAISLPSYAKEVKKRKKAEKRRQKISEYLNKHPMLVRFLSSVGLKPSSEGAGAKKEKVALLYVQGTIGDSVARKTVNAIRKIHEDKDTKAVVVRVTSPGGSIFACETISEELKGLNVPVVFSFGNVAASGGYYIASMGDRIFASRKTVTGSIGVFGIRADLTGLAGQYGVKAQHVSAGDLSALYDPLAPMTRKMKKTLAGCIDRYYGQFKNVVSDGRGLSMAEVEKIAQGRVWTGCQASSNGLVDELGGLYRAIAYARRTFATTEADVVVWPKEQTIWETLVEAQKEGEIPLLLTRLYEWVAGTKLKGEESSDLNPDAADGLVRHLLSTSSSGLPGTLSGVFLTVDENTAIRCLVEGVGEGQKQVDANLFPASFWK